MTRRRAVYAADLFCGGGGTSTGLAQAAAAVGLDVDLVAINHWEVAVATHTANHPWARHLCERIENVDPTRAVPGGKLDLLVASPECIFFSKARGGKPVNDQLRASAWHVPRWLTDLRVEAFLVENVPEFEKWGPVNQKGRPIKRLEGTYFRSWVSALRGLGYNVGWRVLNSADYGACTSRERLFVVGRRGKKPVPWPAPTHDEHARNGLPGWRGAREVLDLADHGPSIFSRKRPLVANTIARIKRGILDQEPRLVGILEHADWSRPIPIPGDLARSLRPFILAQGQGGVARTVDEPMPTIVGGGAHSVTDPVIVTTDRPDTNRSRPRRIEEPVPTVTGNDRIAVAQPFLMGAGGPAWSGEPRPVDRPMPTLLKENHLALAEPFIIPPDGPQVGKPRPRRVDEPMGTIRATRGGGHLVEPFLIPHFGEREGQAPRVHHVAEPLPAVTGHGAGALVEPFVVDYQNGPRSIDTPLDTQLGSETRALVEPQAVPVEGSWFLDVRFRMLKLGELAGAMGFPKGYTFAGTQTDGTKQVGNAVEVNVARSLCTALITGKGAKAQRVLDVGEEERAAA